MYHLCIDSGNTNTVFAVYDGETMLASWRMTTDVNRTADEFAVWLLQLFELKNIDAKKITGAIVANVVPQTGHALYKLCETYFGVKPFYVGQENFDLGIAVRVDTPEEVGADRLVNAVAVIDKYPLPAVVIDFGTATTFDVIDEQGSYLGGVICPGINLSLDALVQGTAKLPRVAIAKPRQVIGKRTEEAMQSGAYWGYAGLIQGILEKIEDEHGKKMTVIATGGLAGFFADVIPDLFAIDRDLTLNGLTKLYFRNARGIRNIKLRSVKSGV
ncbi:MAG: type III pantothenate kinase [Alphaproteobacteria bacterium]|nr:MAG: type III pantothenate kinase [Alphaproteobacteria bacterium]